MDTTYELDFHAWAAEQAELLRSGRLAEAGIANIAEEIASMGRSERNQLTDRLAVLLAHLLKWHYRPGLRGNSWRLTVKEQRRQGARVLAQNPSLQSSLGTILADAYGDAVRMAQKETGLPGERFPGACPWTFDQAMTEPLPEDRPGRS